MTDYKATPEQWEVQEKFAPESEDACCLLELRARIEVIEAQIYRLRCDHLRLVNTCASMAPNRTKFFVDLMPDSDAFELEVNSSAGLTSSNHQKLGSVLDD